MTLEEIANEVVGFVQRNETWAIPVVLALAFGESLAFISLLLPATVALFGIGGLIAASGISFIPIFIAGAVGAALGDWLSFWFGVTFKEPIAKVWPLSRYPKLVPRGHAFVEKYGIYAIFLGRFFGPLRASVPLAAGILDMPFWPFQLANVTSALVWSAGLLGGGYLGIKALM
ncbi:MAG: DedA family protein [Pseudolabrys sp.]|nr:DedA family protein [Pseudolabrys sp.]MBV9260290.1 DedA family protein [Pseudolabrys sp.]